MGVYSPEHLRDSRIFVLRARTHTFLVYSPEHLLPRARAFSKHVDQMIEALVSVNG